MEEIRRNAAEMTRRMLAGEYVNLASDHLRQQLTGEAEPLVHRAAAIALGQLGDKRAIESLQFVAGATSRDDVKKAATDALKRLGAKPK
ncbi:MAG: HEAT repeat domain-containing protein, partial [Lentisphaerae bacterium]|nr:HEAT repeat domain-containing protein [Lentisphaerota bacterium]